MKKDLIEKILREQSTQEEEHLLAQMLQQEEDTSQWLTEDETETYDLIVSQRHSRRRLIRWTAAAIILFAVVAGIVVLWPQTDVNTEKNIAQSNTVLHAPMTQLNTEPQAAPSTSVTITDSIVTPQPTNATEPAKILVAKAKKKVTTSTAESLQIYIARLEQELEQVTDSSYTAKAEEIIRADARLQKLVQRIMIGEIEKNSLLEEALNSNENLEEKP